MAIESNGVVFVIKTAYDNALELVAQVNKYLIDNNITDSKGEQAFITVNAASPIWLILFAIGYAITILQTLTQAAGDSLSIENCSDSQLLNLAAIAGTTRFLGSKTILYVDITAGDSGPCTVTPADLIMYTALVSFEPITTTVIPANTTVEIEAHSTEVGSYVILPGEISSFVGSAPANLSTLTNSKDSIPGKSIETYNELRYRLQGGNSLFSSLEDCIQAIRSLVGITHCNVFFNSSSLDTLVLPGGISILPRNARIIIKGNSDKLAETYLTHMLAETGGALTQDYITLAGQTIPVKYDVALLKNFYIKLVIRAESDGPNFMAEIKRRLVTASGSLQVGINYTQNYLNTFVADFPYAVILGLYISMDKVTWTDTTHLNGNEIGVITSDYISYEEKIV